MNMCSQLVLQKQANARALNPFFFKDTKRSVTKGSNTDEKRNAGS